MTRLLAAAKGGDADEQSSAYLRVQRDLHRIARGMLRHQRPGHSVETAQLADDAFLKLVMANGAGWADRAHFLSVASHAMRNMLRDHERSRTREKRTAGGQRVPLDDVIDRMKDSIQGASLESFDHLLTLMEQFDPSMARLVELRFIGDLSEEQAAAILGIPLRTLQRDWLRARIWLKRHLQ